MIPTLHLTNQHSADVGSGPQKMCNLNTTLILVSFMFIGIRAWLIQLFVPLPCSTDKLDSKKSISNQTEPGCVSGIIKH